MDQWLDFSTSIVSGAALEAVCGVVNQFLSLRTYLVGYQLTIADLQTWGQLHGRCWQPEISNGLTASRWTLCGAMFLHCCNWSSAKHVSLGLSSWSPSRCDTRFVHHHCTASLLLCPAAACFPLVLSKVMKSIQSFLYDANKFGENSSR